jgi:hypothetical protein
LVDDGEKTKTKYDENIILYHQNYENYNLEICAQNAEMLLTIVLK